MGKSFDFKSPWVSAPTGAAAAYTAERPMN